MPNQSKIIHKFNCHDFGFGFETTNGILNITPYEPKVLVIGTFNHGWSWNKSDFFYGRDMYMWPALQNIFIEKKNVIYKRRVNDVNVPDLEEILEICQIGKIVFADIVKGIKSGINLEINDKSQYVLVDNDFKWDKYQDRQLDELGNMNCLDDNVDDIVNYLVQTKSINQIYFTFKSGSWIVDKKNEFIRKITGFQGEVKTIFTPTTNGFGRNLEIPFQKRLWSLTHCWIWNDLPHNVPINKKGYGHLDHDWLLDCGVDINLF
jgi:hypothetical protein